jgi:hypothetical protein
MAPSLVLKINNYTPHWDELHSSTQPFSPGRTWYLKIRSATYPLSRLAMKSLCGPSGKKLVTLNQLVFWLSLGPLFVPTAYFRISCPVLVACNSGVSAKRPIIVIFAKEDRAVEVENVRPPIGSARRSRKDDILGVDFGLTVREGGVDLVETFSGMEWYVLGL